MNIGSINTSYAGQMINQMRSAAPKGDDETQESRTQQISQTRINNARPAAGQSGDAQEMGETGTNNTAAKIATLSGALNMTQPPVNPPVISDNKAVTASAKSDNQESQNQALAKKLANYQTMNQYGKADQGVMAGSFDQKV